MRIVHPLLTVSALGLLNACMVAADEGQRMKVEVEGEKAVGISWAEYRDNAIAASKGSPYIIAEGDLVFASEEALRAHYDENVVGESKAKLTVMRRTSTGYEPVYLGADARDIVYCVSNTFSNKSTVVADMKTATRDWENVANVRFRYLSSADPTCDHNNGNVDFAVMPTTSSGLRGCGANKMLWTLPHVGCPLDNFSGTLIIGVLQMQYGLFPLPPPEHNVTPVGTLRHELGHMIGFRHEHPWSPGGGCNEGQTYAPPIDLTGRQLTSYDQASVMHYVWCNGVAGTAWNISPLDGIGARQIYGMPASWYVILD
jgi:serralysin